MSNQSVVEQFIQNAKRILDKEGASDIGLARIAADMRDLTAHGPAIVPLENADEAAQPRRGLELIHADSSGLTLAHGFVRPERLTPVHSHGTWGVIGIYDGRDRYQIWRRNDGGNSAGPADVELVEERILDPGDVVVFPPPPQDIHAQQASGGVVARELILFGKNVLQQLPHLCFYPDQGYAEEIHRADVL